MYGFECSVPGKTWCCPDSELSNNNIDTVFPGIVAGGDYFFFPTKRSQLFEGTIISNIAHWRSCPRYFVILLNRQLITSNKQNMGFLSVPNLVIWLIFNANILGTRARLSLISFVGSGSTATWQGGDKRKRRWREGWGWGDYFKHVGLRGRLFEGGD